MHRIDDPTAVPTLPAPRAQGTPGYFTGGSPGSSGFAATVVRYEFMNALQEELAHVIETGGGLTLNKTDNTQLLQALQKLFIARTLVTQDTTIYVNPTTGNDSNNGLTAGTAFLTIQAAIDAVFHRFDWNGHGCTIQLADGIYNYTTAGGYPAVFNGTPFGMPPSALHLNGNQPSPQNVKINSTNANCVMVYRGYLNLSGITFSASGTVASVYQNQGLGLVVQGGGWADVQNCQFQACGQSQILLQNASFCSLQGTGVSFTGATNTSLAVMQAGQFYFPGTTINVTGLSTISGFAYAVQAGSINGNNATFVGSATGPRFAVTQNGIVNSGGGGANYFPGNAVGIQNTGGQYV
jgi:hypothetical protein